MLITNVYPSDYTIIDIETTGLSSDRNSIIELSAIKVRKNNIVETYSSLVKPIDNINYFIENLTGISNEMVKNARSVEIVLPEYMNFISRDILLGHNVKFDIRFIAKNLQRYFQRDFKNDYFDTMILSRRFCTDISSHKLSVLADYFNIDGKGHHRGLKDCEMTYYVYESIKQKFADKINI